MHFVIRILLLAATTTCMVPAWPANDLHRLWEDRCGDCHGEAGEFARRHLVVEDGVLTGAHPDRDLRSFLQNHYLKNNEIDAIYAMLQTQAGSRPHFKERCTPCHEKAAQLARESLERRDGGLYMRGTGQPLEEFLLGHASLSAVEVVFFVRLLERVEGEVHRP